MVVPRRSIEGVALRRLTAEGLSASGWSNGPGDRYAEHEHGYDKVLVVTHGSIVLTLPGSGREVELAEGDRLDLPAGVAHHAVVGRSGVVCLEAHLAAGSLGDVPIRVAAWAGSPDTETDPPTGA